MSIALTTYLTMPHRYRSDAGTTPFVPCHRMCVFTLDADSETACQGWTTICSEGITVDESLCHLQPKSDDSNPHSHTSTLTAVQHPAVSSLEACQTPAH